MLFIYLKGKSLRMDRIILLFFCLLTFLPVGAQTPLPEFMEDRIRRADLIVEGRVTDRWSYADPLGNGIYTAHAVQVLQSLAGEEHREIIVVTRGGILGNRMQTVSISPVIHKGEQAYFILRSAKISEMPPNADKECYFLSGGHSAIIPLKTETISGSPGQTENIYQLFADLMKKVYTTEVRSSFPSEMLKSALNGPVITGLSPSEVTAGTGTLLTITGTGFGADRGDGQVWFVAADNPGNIISSSGFKIESWSDTQIRIIVPSEAGTGNVRVRKSGIETVSPSALKIRYSHINLENLPTLMINKDSKGGYTWRIHTNMGLNPGASGAVQRAIGKWVCATSVPWQISSDPASGNGKDGICSISFGDDAGDLENNLGYTNAYYIGVQRPGGMTEWLLGEADIVFNPEANWNFSVAGPGFNQIDFETVVLHELAHAHLMGHLVDSQDLMHWNISAGQTRQISAVNIECGQYILNKSKAFSYPGLLTVQVNSGGQLGATGPISGSTGVCSTSEAYPYSVAPVTNAQTYNWTLSPVSAGTLTFNANQTSVQWSAAFSGNATLSVTPVSACGAVGSTSSLVVNIASAETSSEWVTICEGDSYLGWTESGTYERQLDSDGGCNSIMITYLQVVEPKVTSEEISICQGDRYNGWSMTGEYTRTFTSSEGCDSLVTTKLTVHPKYEIYAEVTICEGESYQGRTTPGQYSEHYFTAAGCDSIIYTTLNVLPVSRISEEVAICFGENYLGWTVAGTYERVLTATSGCDSVVTTHLSILGVKMSEEQVAICAGDNYFGWTDQGIYSGTLTSASGCDSVVTTNLTVLPVKESEEFITICEVTDYLGWSAPGTYLRTLESSDGCDSLIVTHLSFHPRKETSEEVTLCFGESYMGWTESGDYERYLSTEEGCDSVVTIVLTVHPEVHPEVWVKGDSLVASEGYATYQWYNGDGAIAGATDREFVITQSGVYHLAVTDGNGCSGQSQLLGMTWSAGVEVTDDVFDWKVYPNPNEGSFTVQISAPHNENILVRVISSSGQVISERRIEVQGEATSERFHLSGLAKGLYLVTLSGTTTHAVQKVVVR
ncbi:por secretion system C-terminal sorting domain [Bacteroidales bacterium 6E]|nr:por secretion system C-terminal sorting domain [Bacteroidales bacterium 6E]